MQADAIRRGRVRDEANNNNNALRHDDVNNANADRHGTTTAGQEQERARQHTLYERPVVLRLMHVMKSYSMAGTSDKVHALNDITLCEADRLASADVGLEDVPPAASAAAAAAAAETPTPVDAVVAEARTASAKSASVDSNASTHTTVLAMAGSTSSDVMCTDRCRDELDARARRPFAPVHRGEFVMIRGPSGGGKTTLLNIIGLIDACSSGVIELNGMRITNKMGETTLADIRLRSIGFVFQTFNLIPTMTAAENVELPMTLLGKLSHRAMRLRARQLLTLVGLRNRVNHLPSELSGGEQQRVTIARSLANNPSILLLDEPTGDLDTVNTIEIMDLLLRINRYTRTTCIMVTHNPDVECYADRILYVSDGRFVKEVHNVMPMRLDAKRYTAYLDAEERRLMHAVPGDDDGEGGNNDEDGNVNKNSSNISSHSHFKECVDDDPAYGPPPIEA